MANPAGKIEFYHATCVALSKSASRNNRIVKCFHNLFNCRSNSRWPHRSRVQSRK